MSAVIRRQSDGRILTFDAVPSSGLDESFEVTQYAREGGVSGSDDARRLPITSQFTGWITGSPTDQQLTETGSVGADRINEAIAFLRECRGELVDISYPKYQTIRSLQVRGFSYKIDKKNAIAVSISVIESVKSEIQRLSFQRIEAPKPRSAEFEAATDKGKRATEEEDDRSGLAAVRDFLGIGGGQ